MTLRTAAVALALASACARKPTATPPQPPPPPPPSCVATLEVCDGLDNDCNGAVDEGPFPDAPACGGAGVCAGGAQPCVDGAFAACSEADFPPGFEPAEQSCDGEDNDCDGATDARCVWTLESDNALLRPGDVAHGPGGSVFVADTGHRRVVRLEPGGAVTEIIGPDQIEIPGGLAVAADGTLFAADVAAHKILVVPPGGAARVLAGSGAAGLVDGQSDVAQFHQPVGLALGPDGSLYVADLSNHCIRAVSPQGTVRTVAGTGARGFDDGSTGATFDSPRGVAVAADGTLYVADTFNNAIRAIAAGEVVTVAGGSGAGFADGPALEALLDRPYDVATAGSAVFVADAFNHAVRVLASGTLTTLAGNGQQGGRDGLGPTARFALPGGVAAREGFDLLAADTLNDAVRRLRP